VLIIISKKSQISKKKKIWNIQQEQGKFVSWHVISTLQILYLGFDVYLQITLQVLMTETPCNLPLK